MINLITDNIDIWSAAQTAKTNGRGRSADNQNLYGISKLRDLILGMSLRGLFYKKNEPLSKTIEKDIAFARDVYFNVIGRKPKEYTFGPALLDEFSLPSGWIWKRVGELCDLQTGATPSTQKPEYFGGDIRWLVSGDINQGVIEDCEGRITEAGLASSNCKVLPPNTVLIALNGQGKTRATVALLKVPAACNQSLVGIIPFDPSILDAKFLLLSLRYRYFEIRDITGQKQRRGLNMGLVSELSIPLPPLAAQHRIVAKVDELMALCDQLEQQQTESNTAHQILVETLLATLTAADSHEVAEAWRRIASHFETLFTTEHSIDHLKQTILHLAVMGKLVPHEAEWEQTCLGNLGEWAVGNGFPKTEQGMEGLEILFAKVSDMSLPENAKFIVTTNHTISEATAKKLRVNVHAPGTVIFPKIGGAIATNKRRILTCPTVIDNNCLGLYPKEGVSTDWLYLVLSSIDFSKYQAGTSVPALSQGTLAKIPVGLPIPSEQHRIVAKVAELMALCDALIDRINDAQTTQIQLADAIVEQAVA